MGFVSIGKYQVDESIFTAYFACDYERCGAKCCNGTPAEAGLYEGGKLTDSENLEILRNSKYLTMYGDCPSMIEKMPTYEKYGDKFLFLKDGIKCIFCNSEHKICGLKLAHNAGKLSFDIPVHCELYPISLQGDTLLLEDWFSECKYAYEKGKKEKVLVWRFLERPIRRLFGGDFFQSLAKHYHFIYET